MIIWKGWPFANSHLDQPAFCKWSSLVARLLQMIIRMGQPFANDHPDFFRSTGFFSIFFYFSQFSYFPLTNIIFSFKTFLLLLQILGSRLNLTDLSRTMCSCLFSIFSLQWCLYVIRDCRMVVVEHEDETWNETQYRLYLQQENTKSFLVEPKQNNKEQIQNN